MGRSQTGQSPWFIYPCFYNYSFPVRCICRYLCRSQRFHQVTFYFRDFKKYFFGLLLIDFLVFLTGYVLIGYTSITLIFREIIFLTLCFFSITLTSLLIFDSGQKKEVSSQTLHILAAIVIKMLLEMVLALVWFFILKKTDPSNLLLFFVLYLAFSLYSIIFMLKTLKSKSL